jgi:hypothetical protein
MGVEVATLEDLLAEGLRAVCVGINPAPVSVAAGHYYQGRAGQRLFSRLRDAGVIPVGGGGYEDDAAFAAGVGFTDIVKRPTPSAKVYMYNPFDHATFERFKANITERFGHRGMTLLCWNLQSLDVFEADPHWITEVIELARVSDPRIAGAHRHYAVLRLPTDERPVLEAPRDPCPPNLGMPALRDQSARPPLLP